MHLSLYTALTLVVLVQCFFLAIVFWRRGQLADRLLAGCALVLGLNLALDAALFENVPVGNLSPLDKILISYGLLFLVGPLLGGYYAAVLSPTFQLRPLHARHTVVAGLAVIVAYWLVKPVLLATPAPPNFLFWTWHPLHLVANLHLGVYLLATFGLLRRTQRQHQAQAPPTDFSAQTFRKRLSQLLTLAAFVWLNWSLANLLHQEWLFLVLGVGMITLVYGLGYYAQAYRPPAVTSAQSETHPSEKYARSTLTPRAAEHVAQRLTAAMEKEKLYQLPNLTLDSLAERMEVSPHELSQVINQNLATNFYELLNRYRVRTACAALADPNFAQQNLLSIAYEVGFQSKSTFNAAFKKHTGLTPSAYRTQLQTVVNGSS